MIYQGNLLFVVNSIQPYDVGIRAWFYLHKEKNAVLMISLMCASGSRVNTHQLVE